MRTYSDTKATGIKHRTQCAFHLPQMSELAIPSHKNTLKAVFCTDNTDISCTQTEVG